MTVEARAPTDVAPVSPVGFLTFTIAATGGPLALAALFVPQSVSSRSSIGLLFILATMAFTVPVMVWRSFSEVVVSSGGLFAFVEASAGRRVAMIQGAIWIVSYCLYLPYTIDYIVYDLLPNVISGVGPFRSVLEIALPIGLACLGFVAMRTAMNIMAGVAFAQIAVTLLFAFAALRHVGGAHPGVLALHGPTTPFVKGAANVSLLLICGNLSLFLAGETQGGRRTVRSALPLGIGLSAFVALVGSLAWARAGSEQVRAPIPGVALAQAAWGHSFGVLVGLGVVVSVMGVVVAEYFSLTRLLHVMARVPIPRSTAIVAAFFVATSATALVDPSAFYDDLVKPSFAALWVSQIMVFAVYPLFSKIRGHAVPIAISAAVTSAALMGYGLYEAITAYTGN